jgi:hypothetical protein
MDYIRFYPFLDNPTPLSKLMATLAIILLCLSPLPALAGDKTSDLADKAHTQVKSQLVKKTPSVKKIQKEISAIDSSINGLKKLFDWDQDDLYQAYLKKVAAEKADRKARQKARAPAKGFKAKAKRALEKLKGGLTRSKIKKVSRPVGFMRAKPTKVTIRNTVSILLRQKARLQQQLLLVQLSNGLKAIKKSGDKTKVVTICVELKKLLTNALKASPKDSFLLKLKAAVSAIMKRQTE